MSNPAVDNVVTIRILAVVEKNIEVGEYSYDRLFDVIRNWRGFGYRFAIEEHPHEHNSITAKLIENVDQLWFFGSLVENDARSFKLTADEQQAIQARMDAGVGVFATGDHEDVGVKLCAELPRVALMRVWSGGTAPGRAAPSSYDSTIRSPYQDIVDPDPQLMLMDPAPSDERDSLPKVVWAHHDGETPHELMQLSFRKMQKGRIRFLPDHMHEGKLIDYKGLELPEAFKGHRPLIVARSVRAVFDGLVPVDCTSYPVVSAYEPSEESGLGNIVVDSTFHHWTDSNILRLRYSPAWLHVEQYAINIANWLLGANGRNKVRGAVYQYFEKANPAHKATIEQLAPGLSLQSRLKIFTDFAMRVEALVCRHRVIVDTLRRIMLLPGDPAPEIQVNDLLKELKLGDTTPNEVQALRDSGVLESVLLGLQFEKLRAKN